MLINAGANLLSHVESATILRDMSPRDSKTTVIKDKGRAAEVRMQNLYEGIKEDNGRQVLIIKRKSSPKDYTPKETTTCGSNS